MCQASCSFSTRSKVVTVTAGDGLGAQSGAGWGRHLADPAGCRGTTSGAAGAPIGGRTARQKPEGRPQRIHPGQQAWAVIHPGRPFGAQEKTLRSGQPWQRVRAVRHGGLVRASSSGSPNPAHQARTWQVAKIAPAPATHLLQGVEVGAGRAEACAGASGSAHRARGCGGARRCGLAGWCARDRPSARRWRTGPSAPCQIGGFEMQAQGVSFVAHALVKRRRGSTESRRLA